MKTVVCHAFGQNPVEVEDSYEEEYCCAGQSNECGCNGYPTNPIFCDACEEKIFKKARKP